MVDTGAGLAGRAEGERAARRAAVRRGAGDQLPSRSAVPRRRRAGRHADEAWYSPHWRAAEQHGSVDPRFPLEWYVEFQLERESIAASDAWYAPSRLLCERYRQELHLDVALIRPPAYAELETAAWDHAWYRAATAGRTPYLAFVNAVNRRKGGHVLAAALPRFFAACPDVHLHVLGQGLDCLDLVCRDADGARRPNVHYHGVGGHDRVYPLLAGAMGLVFPSLIDNLPNSVIEALTLGVPAVVTEGSSADELVQHEESGLVVPQNDPDRLADAMIRLVRTPPDARASMGERSRTSVGRLLDPGRAVQDLEHFFEAAQGLPRRRRLDAEQSLRLIAASLRDLYTLSGQVGAEREKREAFAPLVVELVVDGVRSAAVYGAGEAGQLLARELALHGIRVTCFIDANREQWGSTIGGVEIVSLEQARAGGEQVVAIGSIAYCDEIAERIAREADRHGWRPRVCRPGAPGAGPQRAQEQRIA